MSDQSYFTQAFNDSFNFINDTNVLSQSCVFQRITRLVNLVELLRNGNCYRHSLSFSVFLCVANLLVLLFGVLGNALVLYVVINTLQLKTASSIFMLNLAVADLLVIVSCMPATLAANVLTPWIFSEATCKIVAYSQRLSVFCSVYSLVAISFDRCRAMHSSVATAPNITKSQACKIVLLIWMLGFGITLPWAFSKEPSSISGIDDETDNFKPAFCEDIWKTATHEAAYFLLVQVLARFAVPVLLISLCSIFVWKNMPDSASAPLLLIPTCIDFRITQRKRKLRILKVYIAVNLAFILFWLPLYVITARLNFSQSEEKEINGTKLESQLASFLLPIAQLLGSCNNCINPVLYCILSEKFREPLISIFRWIRCFRSPRSQETVYSVSRDGNGFKENKMGETNQVEISDA